MSEFHIKVVRIGKVERHPNADTLDITHVYDYPVVIRRGDFAEGDLAVYVPIDSIVPDTEEWAFLGSKRRIKAKKLRGVFSQGLLTKLPRFMFIEGTHVLSEGDDVRELMGITKYEPPLPLSTGGECEPAPKGWMFPVYTDIEGLRRHPDVLKPGEEVVIHEKIHGTNARFVHDGTRLWVGSHTQIKRFDEKSIWWQVAGALGLEPCLATCPMHVFFGEVFGQVQDLKYGVSRGALLRLFDVFDVRKGCYLGYDEARALAVSCGLDWVPELYRGPWDPTMSSHAEGKSTLADHVREGFVVKPVKERWNDACGRVVLKRIGEGYLLRKDA
jgi:RNA ligase (TIGR02306 family)